mgnify:FL=1
MKMNRKIVMSSLLSVGVALSLAAAPAYADEGHTHGKKQTVLGGNPASVKAITKALQGYAKVVRVKDIEKMGLFLAGEQFSVVEGQHANWGWIDYRDNHLKPEFNSSHFKLLDYKITDVKVKAGKLLSYAIYKTHLEYEQDGVKKTNHGMATAILERKGNGWLIRHIHSS